MKNIIIISSILFSSICFGQDGFDIYLKSNRQDLTQNSLINIGRAKLIGFGALHGSSKTEETEIILLEEFATNHNLKYYLPETDYSTANYFQKYIETGDEELLKELVIEYGTMVPQEKSIEVFEKWKEIRPLFLKSEVRVIGVDKISSYKFSIKELLSITQESKKWSYRDSLSAQLENPNTDWSVFENQKLKLLIKNFVEDYEKNESAYQPYVKDNFSFNHILKNLKHTYETDAREPFIYDNYIVLNKKYSFDSSLHFARFGIFHLMKNKINNGSSFFSMLIEKGIYSSSEIKTIQGFLTKSSVMWNKFDKKGNFKYTTKKGFGIGDYWLEYFYKIKDLKRHKLSDITLFRLNDKDSPYSKENEFRLVKVKKLLGNSRWHPTKGKNTLDYIDYAILISNSKANRPLKDLK